MPAEFEKPWNLNPTIFLLLGAMCSEDAVLVKRYKTIRTKKSKYRALNESYGGTEI